MAKGRRSGSGNTRSKNAIRPKRPKDVVKPAPLPPPQRLPSRRDEEKARRIAKELKKLGVPHSVSKKALASAGARKGPKVPKPGKVQVRSEAWRARETLEIAKERLLERHPKMRVIYRVRANADGIVTGELRVSNWPKNVGAHTMSYHIEDAIGVIPQGHWISAGARFPFPVDRRVEYKKRGDLASVSAHYQPDEPQRVFLAIRDILANMKKRKRRAPEELLVRLQWNAANQQPRRKF